MSTEYLKIYKLTIFLYLIIFDDAYQVNNSIILPNCYITITKSSFNYFLPVAIDELGCRHVPTQIHWIPHTILIRLRPECLT